MPASRALGIDLGTSTTTLACIDAAGRSAMVRNPQGDVSIPSTVYFEDQEVVVGRTARNLAATQPNRAAEFVKRDLGQPAYSRAIGGELFSAEVIEACLLKKHVGTVMTPNSPKPAVVLSVPASFDQAQRRAMIDAAQIAGLEVLSTIRDTLAAALAFAEAHGYLAGEDKPGCRLLVFDLGGGKLDVAIVEIKPGRIRTLAVRGDAKLGGRDWDLRLAEYLAGKYVEKFEKDPRYDMVSVRRLQEQAEEAKQTLSARQQARVHVERDGNAAEIELTRLAFDEATEDLVERARTLTASMPDQAGVAWADLAYVLLVGGGTRMPAITRMLQEVTGLSPVPNVPPGEAVARGAALYADRLLASRGGKTPGTGVELVDLTTHSIGIEWIDPDSDKAENVVIVTRGTELPCATMAKASTTQDDQRSITVHLLEGDSREAQECSRIASLTIRELPAGLPRNWSLDVRYQFTADGGLQAQAVLPKSGQPLPLELRRERGLSRAEAGGWKKLLETSEGLGGMLGYLAKQEKKPIAGASAPLPVGQVVQAGEGAPPPPLPGSGGKIGDFDLETDGESTVSRMKKRRLTPRKIAIMLAGHVLFATLGLAIGYYILMRINPSYNYWNLRLPGLSDSSSGDSPAPR